MLSVSEALVALTYGSLKSQLFSTVNTSFVISDGPVLTVFLSRQSGNQCSLPRLGHTDDRLNICRVKPN